MKSISIDLSTHLDGEVTTLATCWKIIRTDGVEFFFTDHDQDITFEGDIYEAESSYDRTAIKSGSDFSVDNLDVTGVLDSEKINDEELRSGLFNRADVYVFIVNWANPSQGAVKIRRGWFGEVTLRDNGQFTTEIRGLAQALSHNFIEVCTAECRADFCDSRCKLNLADYSEDASIETSTDRSSFVLAVGTTLPENGISPGFVTFLDGDNAGRGIEIIGYDEDTRVVDLFENVPYTIADGTMVTISSWCDRSLASCINYDNVVNRRAEDYVPGNDDMMTYPDAQ